MYSFRKKLDSKLIKAFQKLNTFKVKNNNSVKKILLVDRNLPEANIVSSYFAYLVNKKFKYDIYLLNNQSPNNELNKIYESFNLKKTFNINIKQKIFYQLDLIFKTIIYFVPNFFFILSNSRKWIIENFKIHNIYLGDVVYDTYIRQDNNYDKENLLNFKFLKIIFITLYKFFYIDKLLDNKKFNFIISNTHTYASNSTLAMRIGLKKKIKIINLLSSRIRFYEKLEQSYRSELCLDLRNIKKKKLTDKNWKKKIDIYLNKRFKGKIKQQTTIDAFSKKQRVDLDKLFLKKKYKKVILFAPHAFSDANHGRGKMIFDSYYHQFLETLKIAKKNKEFLWIIKNHPSNYKYKSKKYIHGEEEIVKSIIGDFKKTNIQYCPKYISTYSLIKFSDLIITGRGSIGMEAAVLGKKALLCGESFYSNLGITIDPKNQKEYERIIMRFKKDRKLSKSKILLAKKIFYMFAFKNSHIKEDMIERNNYIEVNVKDKKINQKFFSIEEYLKKFLVSLKTYKNIIIYDTIFKHYVSEFKNYIRLNDKNFKKN